MRQLVATISRTWRAILRPMLNRCWAVAHSFPFPAFTWLRGSIPVHSKDHILVVVQLRHPILRSVLVDHQRGFQSRKFCTGGTPSVLPDPLWNPRFTSTEIVVERVHEGRPKRRLESSDPATSGDDCFCFVFFFSFFFVGA